MILQENCMLYIFFVITKKSHKENYHDRNNKISMVRYGIAMDKIEKRSYITQICHVSCQNLRKKKLFTKKIMAKTFGRKACMFLMVR